MAAGLRRAGFDEVRELPLADGGEGTLDALLACARWLAAHGDASPDRSATGRRRVGAAARRRRGGRDGARRAASRSCAARNDPLRASTRGTGELIAAAIRAGARRVIVGVGGSATHRRRTGRGRDARMVAAARCRSRSRATCRPASSTRHGVFGPQKGATRRAGRAAHPPARAARRPVRSAHGRRRARARGRRRRRRPRRRARRDRRRARARLRRGRGRRRARGRARRRRPRASPARASSTPPASTGKVVGGVLEWAPTPGVPHLACDRRPGHAPTRARRSAVFAERAGARAHRPRLAGGRGLRPRAAVLVEEAAYEAARNALVG